MDNLAEFLEKDPRISVHVTNKFRNCKPGLAIAPSGSTEDARWLPLAVSFATKTQHDGSFPRPNCIMFNVRQSQRHLPSIFVFNPRNYAWFKPPHYFDHLQSPKAVVFSVGGKYDSGRCELDSSSAGLVDSLLDVYSRLHGQSSSIICPRSDLAITPKVRTSPQVQASREFLDSLFNAFGASKVSHFGYDVDVMIDGCSSPLRAKACAVWENSRRDISYSQVRLLKHADGGTVPVNAQDADFDFLIASYSADSAYRDRYVFIIPKAVLLENGVLADPSIGQRGSTSFYVYPNTFRRQPTKYAWTRDYLVDLENLDASKPWFTEMCQGIAARK